MPDRRSTAVLAVTFACWAIAADGHAQEPAAVPAAPRCVETSLGSVSMLRDRADAVQAKVTLWVRYAGAAGDLADHRQYLEDLQVRYAERGVAIAVVLPEADAKALAAEEPRFLVGADDGHETAPTSVLLCRGGQDLLGSAGLDGAVDVLERALGDEDPQRLPEDHAALEQLVEDVADGGAFGELATACLAAWPRSGRAHAAAALFHWWCEGDLAAGRAAVERGVDALAGEAFPMTVFADLVLRGDADRAVAERLAGAMAPAAASAPDGMFTQLVYLRALLRAGQDRLAGRLVATLPKRLAGHSFALLVFAETLMEAHAPAAFRDAAMAAIAAAERLQEEQQDGRWPWAARHKVFVRCGDADAAAKLMHDYREQNVSSYGLNNDAWYLMVRPLSMGRFDTLALAQCEEMLRVEGAGIDFNSQDTCALAFFRNGRVDRAVELQKEVVRVAGGNAAYLGRLRRYEATPPIRGTRPGAAGR